LKGEEEVILQDFEKKIFKFIRDYKIFNKYDKILLGVSGGKDSMSLLHVMFKLSRIMGFEVSVAHLNHCMREEADSDEAFVRRVCEKLSVPFFSKKADVFTYSKENKVGVEVAGRNLRYEFFYETLRMLSYNKIATAHHMDDLFETMIYRILRGTGIYGLGGLIPIEEEITKPMLCIDLEEIKNYVTINNIEYVEDKYNYSLDYSRNKIRYEFTPLFEQINPRYKESFFRLAKIIWSYREEVKRKFEERSEISKDSLKLRLENDFFDGEIIRIAFLKFGKYPPNMEETEKIIKMRKGGVRKINGLSITKKSDSLLVKI
jgi:tRNA(Ile)-lysidine synthase